MFLFDLILICMRLLKILCKRNFLSIYTDMYKHKKSIWAMNKDFLPHECQVFTQPLHISRMWLKVNF